MTKNIRHNKENLLLKLIKITKVMDMNVNDRNISNKTSNRVDLEKEI